MSINWTVTREEMEAIRAIAIRAEESGIARADRMTLIMDLTAAHANGSPLDLAGLLAADEFNFAHDVAGIQRHIDRRTGELLDCFLPRYSRRGEAA